MKMKYFIYTFLVFYFYDAYAVDTIHIRTSQSEFDASHSYYVVLIKLAYKKTIKKLILFSPLTCHKKEHYKSYKQKR